MKIIIKSRTRKTVGLIYKITNMINDKIYIGQTSNLDRRIKEYKRASKNPVGRYKYKIIEEMYKYEFNSFMFTVIDYCYSKDDMNMKEIYWIERLNARDPEIGYNKKSGGEGGTMTIDSINKMKETSSLFRHSTETKIAKSKPILAVKCGVVYKYYGAKQFGASFGYDRSIVTRSIRQGTRLSGFYLYYMDIVKRNEIYDIVNKKRTDKTDYNYSFNLILEGVETIEITSN